MAKNENNEREVKRCYLICPFFKLLKNAFDDEEGGGYARGLQRVYGL